MTEATVPAKSNAALVRLAARSAAGRVAPWRGVVLSLSRVARYALVRAATIGATIGVGVLLTVLIANRQGSIDDSVRSSIEQIVQRESYAPWTRGSSPEELTPILNQMRQEMAEAAGLTLPPLARHLRWTANLLTFQWGDVATRDDTLHLRVPTGPDSLRYRVQGIILAAFPNTLLLVGAAYGLLFCLGVPLALYLSSRHGQWLDRLVAGLSPLSSIPSWVLGIVLVMIFSAGLRLLPFGGMLDPAPPASAWARIPMLLKHMLLPVLAILLSLFFQCVVAWRTFFLIYSHEDYVELAQAKGLPPARLQRRYILRPSLPYVLTSFALTLISFWQLTAALEYYFSWPGIGRLYVEALDTVDVVVVVGIVVVFAYLLGAVVFLLDVVYALVDPRVRLGSGEPSLRPKRLLGRRRAGRAPRRRATPAVPRPTLAPAERARMVRRWAGRLVGGLRALLRYPSAVVGLALIAGLVALSIAAVVRAPYAQAASLWVPERTGTPTRPRNALPVWINAFLRRDLPPTLILDSQAETPGEAGQVLKSVHIDDKGRQNVGLTFQIDYPYGGFPEELTIYFAADYEQKKPFVDLTWTTPDGREFDLGGFALVAGDPYLFAERIPRRYATGDIRQEDALGSGRGGAAPVQVLFADPQAARPAAVEGTYTLQIDGLLFEPGSDLDARLELLGAVYGLAGTDHLRRDLSIPLLWGAPVALGIGLLGAGITSLVSVLVAAAGAWFGGAADSLVQRLIEANMILPILGVGVLLSRLYGIGLWTIMGLFVLLNAFGSPAKAYRAAFLQVKEAPYLEAARAYGAGHWRVIRHYLVRRIVPLVVPQLVILVPSYVFLESTLAIFHVSHASVPTWGRLIYDAVRAGVFRGEFWWLLEPVGLLMLTGLAFALLGFALDKILNPRLREV